MRASRQRRESGTTSMVPARAMTPEQAAEAIRKAQETFRSVQERTLTCMPQASMVIRFFQGMFSIVPQLGPMRRLQAWIDDKALGDPIDLTKERLRENVSELQGAIVGEVGADEFMTQEAEGLRKGLETADKENWEVEEYYQNMLLEAKKAGLEMDDAVIGLVEAMHVDLPEKDRQNIAMSLRRNTEERLRVSLQSRAALGEVRHHTSMLLGLNIGTYLAFSGIAEPIAAMRDSAEASLKAGAGAVDSRQLLLDILSGVSKALEAATSAAVTMDQYRLCGPQMVNALQDTQASIGRDNQRLLALGPAPGEDGRALEEVVDGEVIEARALETTSKEEEKNGQ